MPATSRCPPTILRSSGFDYSRSQAGNPSHFHFQNGGLISNPAQARNAVEGFVQAYDRLSVVTAKTRNPIVVFPKSLPDGHHFSIYIRGRLRHSTMHRQNRPPF